MSASGSQEKSCLFSCANAKDLFRFPKDREAAELWLKIIGFSVMPRSRNKAFLCTNHFSRRQFSAKGTRLTRTSIPDQNIPIITTSITKPVIITSENSNCFLKCKTYKFLKSFPVEFASVNHWLSILGRFEKVKEFRQRKAKLCNNHFSINSSKRASLIPDTNLPSQCRFIDEFEMLDKPPVNISSENVEMIETITPDACYPVDHTTTNGGIVESVSNNGGVLCPEDCGVLQCVLKCPDGQSLYRFPNVESRRQLWLSQIGLTHCLYSTRICCRHFSDKMFSNQKLSKFAYPDVNLPELRKPLIRVASLPLQNEKGLKVIELPQYICVLTVVKTNDEVDTVINGTKYIKHTVDRQLPKRDRTVQVDVDDLIRKADVAISAADDDDELEFAENINDEQQTSLIINNIVKPPKYPSKGMGMFECLICGEISIDYDSNVKHFNLHNKSKCMCVYCGQMFGNKLKLINHEINIHSTFLKQKQLIRCPKEHCKKAFHLKKNLDQHLEDEHLKRCKHRCKKCGRLFFSSLKLHCHLLACTRKTMRSR